MTGLPLAGVRVADFTWVGAGPFLTKPLADHGADVIKIESRSRMDPVRNMRPFRDGTPGVNRSGYFANRNSSKRSICLDLKDAHGQALALRLIEASDIVANNFTPGTMSRLGLGYEEAQAVRPDVIYLEMPMQGASGPHAGFRGYGLTIGAVGGFLALSGWPDRPPLGTGTNYPDHVPNPLHSAIAVLAALRHRQRTGEGQYIELAQLESTVNIVGPATIAEQLGHEPPNRQGNTDRHAAPHGVYPCLGDWTDTQWTRLCDVLDAPAWLTDERFSTLAGRRGHREALDGLITARTAVWRADHLANALATVGIPAAEVSDAADLLADDQLRERGHWVSLDHPEMGTSVYDAPPYRLSRTPGCLRSPAPLLGGDTEDVCRGLLGVSESEYADLCKRGVVG
jgi:benzylsuccinate CoA-transferase BbsF subunit